MRGATSEMPVIEARHLSFSYDDASAPALDDVSFSVEEGEFVAIAGANGSGKTTLARHLDALLPLQRGSLEVAGIELRPGADAHELRRRCQMVFQNPENQFVSSVVGEDVAFAPLNFGASASEAREAAARALDQVGLAGYEDRDVHDLSGGQQQRVAIAGALAASPEVLVLDEATSMLDDERKSEVIQVIEGLRGHGTVVAVTHDMELAARCDRLLVMRSGRLVACGAPAEVLADAGLLASCGLSAPAVVEVWRELRALGLCADAPRCPLDFAELAELLRPSLAGGCPPGVRAPIPEPPSTPVSPEPGAARATLALEDTGLVYDRGLPGERVALEGANLAARSGEVVALVGRTGAGKTSALELAAGLTRPSSGVAEFCGRDLARDARARRELEGRLGFAFQFPERQLFETSVGREVGFALRVSGLGTDEVARGVRTALTEVGLEPDEVLTSSPFSLSGGQRRRVALASVLAPGPDVVMLDEPTAGLDPLGRANVSRLVRRLACAGALVLLSSHDCDFVAETATRVVALADGRVVLEGDVRATMGDAARMRSVGLAASAAARGAERLAQAWGCDASGLGLVGVLGARELAGRLAGLCRAAGARAAAREEVVCP